MDKEVIIKRPSKPTKEDSLSIPYDALQIGGYFGIAINFGTSNISEADIVYEKTPYVKTTNTINSDFKLSLFRSSTAAVDDAFLVTQFLNHLRYKYHVMKIFIFHSLSRIEVWTHSQDSLGKSNLIDIYPKKKIDIRSTYLSKFLNFYINYFKAYDSNTHITYKKNNIPTDKIATIYVKLVKSDMSPSLESPSNKKFKLLYAAVGQNSSTEPSMRECDYTVQQSDIVLSSSSYYEVKMKIVRAFDNVSSVTGLSNWYVYVYEYIDTGSVELTNAIDISDVNQLPYFIYDGR